MVVEFPEIVKFDDKVKFPFDYIQVLCEENEEKINLYKTYNEDFFEKCNINFKKTAFSKITLTYAHTHIIKLAAHVSTTFSFQTDYWPKQKEHFLILFRP